MLKSIPKFLFLGMLLSGMLLTTFVVLAKDAGNIEQLPDNPSTNSSGIYLPWQYLQSKTMTQGWNGSYSHTGMMAYAYDFNLSNNYIYAVQGGTVAHTKSDSNVCGGQDFANYGNYVVINHYDGKATLYLHLLHNGVAVWPGQQVSQGQWLGFSGATGWTNCNAHLHFQRQDQGGWYQQSIPVYFQEHAGELSENTAYQSWNQCTGYCPASIGEYHDNNVNYVILQNNEQVISHPEYKFSVSCPDGLLVREWKHPDSPFVVYFVDEVTAGNGGELPEVSLVVHPKSAEESLSDWLQKTISRSSYSDLLDTFPVYLDVTDEMPNRISNHEAISFQHSFPIPRQVTVIDNGSAVIQISYGPIGNSDMENIYEYILKSFTANNPQ
jgi:hypothetical protein